MTTTQEKFNAEQNVIKTFTGKYAFLSNFYPSKFVEPTVEHQYQAAKTENPLEIDLIMEAETPGLAKKYGKRATVREDWNEVKDKVMEDLVREKFRDPELREKLLDTSDAILSEGNFWHDNYWGQCVCAKCSAIIGKNKLGKILMKVRREIMEEAEGRVTKPSLFRSVGRAGLFQKYIVSKTNGEPIDPNANYFVLRLDTDPAARYAAAFYARATKDLELKGDLSEVIMKNAQFETDRDLINEFLLPEREVEFMQKKSRSYRDRIKRLEEENKKLRNQKKTLYEALLSTKIHYIHTACDYDGVSEDYRMAVAKCLAPIRRECEIDE